MKNWITENNTGLVLEQELLEGIIAFEVIVQRADKPLGVAYARILDRTKREIEMLSECRLYIERDINKRSEFAELREEWLNQADGIIYSGMKG